MTVLIGYWLLYSANSAQVLTALQTLARLDPIKTQQNGETALSKCKLLFESTLTNKSHS